MNYKCWNDSQANAETIHCDGHVILNTILFSTGRRAHEERNRWCTNHYILTSIYLYMAFQSCHTAYFWAVNCLIKWTGQWHLLWYNLFLQYRFKRLGSKKGRGEKYIPTSSLVQCESGMVLNNKGDFKGRITITIWSIHSCLIGRETKRAPSKYANCHIDTWRCIGDRNNARQRITFNLLPSAHSFICMQLSFI